MVFGDPADGHHARALAIVDDTETQLSRALMRTTRCDAPLAVAVSRAVSALLLRNLAARADVGGSIEDIIANVRRELSPLVALISKR
jgi:hypothetical protein